MTEDSFADFVRLADCIYKQGDTTDHARAQAQYEQMQRELATQPSNVRRVAICLLILNNLRELVHGPD